MAMTDTTSLDKPKRSRQDWTLGLLFLGLNLIISVAAQFVLKAGMAKLGAFDPAAGVGEYLFQMVNIQIIGGLVLYGTGTILWLLCLSKLDLSFAYPAATLQYVLIFAGAWLLFEETINWQRLAGLAIILGGVIVIAMDPSTFKTSS